jgi:hypothetical protein
MLANHGIMTGKNARRNEGAAMLVVMLILLIATAAAAISVQATTMEMRSAGYARRELQTKYVAEAALASAYRTLNQVGPRSLLYAMSKATVQPDMTRLHEPALSLSGSAKTAYRIVSDDYPATIAAPMVPPVNSAEDGSGTLGPGQAYQPWFAVDIYDHYSAPSANPGYRLEGYGSLYFMYANFTARGFTIPSGASGPVNDPLSDGQFNQAAFTACGTAQLGPFTP